MLLSTLVMAEAASYAQNLPATPPTTALLPTTAPLTATSAQMDAATRAHRAEVQYASGLLSVNANNSSLNQILRDISKATGMKISGGVRDERVFGHYGPAATGDVLATLIDGTGTNMLLRQGADAAPEELILTPRNGGATPPNPNAPGFDSSDDDNAPRQPQQFSPGQPPYQPSQPQPIGPPSIPPPANNVNGSSFNVTPTASQIPTTNSVPTDSIPTPSTTPPSPGIVDTPNPPDPSTVDPATASPNGVKTPEQIYQQLQQMRQQQQKTPQ